MTKQLPFGMLKLDTTTHVERGYTIYPSDWLYDPLSQTTNQVLMGKTEPTTYSSVGTTGIFNNDGDEGADDTGTD